MDSDINQIFEEIISTIFSKAGFNVKRMLDESLNSPDLVVYTATGKAVVDTKVYRSLVAPAGQLLKSAMIIENIREETGADFGIIAVANDISSPLRQAISRRFPKIKIYDENIILELLSNDFDEYSKYIQLLHDARPFSKAIQISKSSGEKSFDIQDIKDDLKSAPNTAWTSDEKSSPHTPFGGQLCNTIKSIPPGQKTFAKFERDVGSALKYIFDSDLTSWTYQEKTDTGISRFDYICRISSDHDFWKTIIRSFGTRYIIFEMKNHSGEYGQGEIYTTEKYLFRTALRSVAFIISPNGGDSNARAAAQGALRENGKLIIDLNIQRICEMLTLKDSGDDHNSVLVTMLDELLMRIER